MKKRAYYHDVSASAPMSLVVLAAGLSFSAPILFGEMQRTVLVWNQLLHLQLVGKKKNAQLLEHS